MTDHKYLDNHLVAFLMDAVENAAKLELEIEQLRWESCFGEYPCNTFRARKQCRELLGNLKMVDLCLRQWADKEAANSKIVSIEEQRKKP